MASNPAQDELDRYRAVRARTESLAAPLSDEDQVVQSQPDCSPTKWHRAHTTWFFEEFILRPSAAGYQPLDDAYRFLFNSYYEAVGPRQPRPYRGLITRPSVAEVAAFRRHVDAEVDRLLTTADPDRFDTLAGLFELGRNHEQQHQELLLMDILHLFSCNPLRPAYGPGAEHGTTPTPKPVSWVEHPGGLVGIGHDPDLGFAYDNESPRHQAFLAPFALADRLVTAGEWLDFMADGGYERPEFWLSDGWARINADGWRAPDYWEQVDGRWHVFTLNGLAPVDPAGPVVHVSYYEADAYAHWAGARLPLEAEWEAVAATQPPPRPDGFALHPRGIVDEAPPGGASQLYGEVWQWTSSAYSAYPGFQIAPGAVGEYNGKFMIDQQVLRGSACVTPDGHARLTYRNFFPAGARWAFSGLRLAHDV